VPIGLGSMQALYFESSPVPGVFGNFAKYLGSQSLNKTLNRTFTVSMSSKANQNGSLVFAQDYMSINFSSEANKTM
jgi:hypothetical protein